MEKALTYVFGLARSVAPAKNRIATPR